MRHRFLIKLANVVAESKAVFSEAVDVTSGSFVEGFRALASKFVACRCPGNGCKALDCRLFGSFREEPIADLEDEGCSTYIVYNQR